ncbi:MAG TPA: hypothetical protein VFS43_01190 [Polyangiaceae bacterium]|nr:hypothetical protein [Polyangiaceae bacterium]
MEQAYRRQKANQQARAAPSEGAAGGGAPAGVPAKEMAQAYLWARPQIEAMPPAASFRRLTVSIPDAVTIGLGAVPNIEARMAELREHSPKYDHVRAGRLREYAYAALHAHYRVAVSSDGEARLRVLAEEAAPVRERLLRAAEWHAHDGDLDPEVVATIRQGTGYLDTANDLGQLVLLFRDAGAKLAGRTSVTEADLERASELSRELIEAVGRRRVGTDGASAPSEAEETRLKAFWLFHGVYDESRRAMADLRWHEGDADRLVPSLFLGHRRRGPSAREPGEGEAPAEPSEPSEPSESE